MTPRCLVVLCVWALSASVSAQDFAGALRPLNLPRGHGRVDVGPPDYGYMDHGELNVGRGLRFIVPSRGDTQVFLGAGGAFGVTDQLEVGGLVLPLRLAPDSDLGDLEGYVRYAFEPQGQVALQATLQLPTESELGLGFGVPIFVALGGGNRIETGAELELVFYDDALINLDFPAAFQFALGGNAFAGPRTGILVVDLEEVAINFGGQIGLSVTRVVALSGSLNWPLFLWTGPGDAINIDAIEVILAANFYL